MPLVSVIIPTFNRAGLVTEAIASVRNQTYQDLEIIVVDDGSTDNTLDVLNKYRCPELVCIAQRNQGLAEARNNGIHASRGAYIAFLDDDDVWFPKKIELQVEEFEKDPRTTLVYGTAYKVIGGSRSLVFTDDPPASDVVLERLFERNFVGNPSVVMVRADALRRTGLFDPAVGPYSDWDLWLRIARSGGGFAHVREPIAEYRHHGNNMVYDSAGMNDGLVAMLEKFLSNPDTPVHLKAQRTRRLSQALIRAGMDYYIALRFGSAWQAWIKGARLDPTVITPQLISLMVRSLFGPQVILWLRKCRSHFVLHQPS